MTGKPTFPIKWKLILLLTCLLAMAIFVFTYLAMQLFVEDKEAYIYENGLANSSSLARELEGEIRRAFEKMRAMDEAFSQGENGKDIALNLFNANSNFFDFTVYDDQKNQVLQIIDQEHLDTSGLSKEQYLHLTGKLGLPFDKLSAQNQALENPQIPDLPHLFLMLKKETGHFLFARLKSSQLVSALNRNKAYQSVLIDSFGRPVLGSTEASDTIRATELPNLIKDGEGVRRIEAKKNPSLLAFSKVQGQDLLVVSIISVAKAFEVIRFLKEKSLYTALLVISIGLLVAAVFTRQLTGPIEQLSLATQRISQGDFTSRTDVNSNDEIGLLANSFDFMSSEIMRFTEEIKDKARMENELRVGQLVQERFIPPPVTHLGAVRFNSFFQSASECGGDIWGAWQDGSSTYFYIADASGHGVPAALLTAAVKAFFDTVVQDNVAPEGALSSPSKLMEKLNKVVVKAGGELNMTLLLFRYDPLEQALTYTNASHPPALLFASKEELSKQDIQSLTGALGPRLGEKLDATYTEKRVAISEGQNLLIYTDGIVECTCPKGKAYGERRLIKAALEALNQKKPNIVEAIIEDGLRHFEGNPADDDITIVQVSFPRAGEINAG